MFSDYFEANKGKGFTHSSRIYDTKTCLFVGPPAAIFTYFFVFKNEFFEIKIYSYQKYLKILEILTYKQI